MYRRTNSDCLTLPILLVAASLITGCAAREDADPANTGGAGDTPALPTTNPDASDSFNLEVPDAGSGPDNPSDPATPDTTTPDNNQPSTGDDNTPVAPAPDDDDEVTGDDERSPVDLLFNEVRLAASEPLLMLNRKLTSGELLDNNEIACISSFNPAFGDPVAGFDCPAQPVLAYATVLVQTMEFDQAAASSGECQRSLFAQSVEGCELVRADLTLPVRWEAIANPAPGQIATVQPLPGARLRWNEDNNGVLLINELSPLSGRFSCAVDLDTQQIDDLLEGNESSDCRSRIDQLIRSLFELRSG